MTKTLHLYEAHFNALMEEVLASPQRLMCTAVLEPFMGPPQPSNTSSQRQEQQAATQPPLGSEPAVEGNSDNTPGTMSQALRWMAAQQSQGISAGQGMTVEGLGAAAGRFNGSSSSSGTGVGSESDPDESAWMPLGSYVGGANYILSCGCLVKVSEVLEVVWACLTYSFKGTAAEA